MKTLSGNVVRQAGNDMLRKAALELRGVLEQELGSGE